MVDIQKIIKESGLRPIYVAEQLFPHNKYPMLALDRVIKGLSYLDSRQLYKLSLLSGIPIQDLFKLGDWHTKQDGGKLILSNDNYTAVINNTTGCVEVYHSNDLMFNKIIVLGTKPLSVFLQELETLINNYTRHEHN